MQGTVNAFAVGRRVIGVLLRIGILLCYGIVQAQTVVTITDTLKSPFDGANFNGRLEITSQPLTCGTSTYPGTSKRYVVVNGAVSLTLIAYTSCLPAGTSYTVRYVTDNGISYTRYWVVPANPSVTTVSAVETATVASPSLAVTLAQVSLLTGLSGKCLGSNDGQTWAAVACSGGGSVSSVFTRTGAIVAQSGDYTTAQVTEAGGNLYFTNARARSAVSAFSPVSYDSATGTVSCPTCTTGGPYEPVITGGTIEQYWRGDKTWQTLPTSESPLTFSSPLSRSINTISLPVATSLANGYLSSTDWSTFNNKVATSRAISTTSPLQGGGDLSANRTISLLMWGTGTRPVAAAALGTAGNCVQWTASGLGDTGAACGTGGGSGANALGYYLVSRSTDAPVNAVNLGALTSGLLRIGVSGGVATVATAVAGTDFAAPSHTHSAATDITGTLGVSNGGTGNTAAADNAVLVGNGTTYVVATLPSCSNSTTSKLLYDTSTRTFSCGTDQSGSGGGIQNYILSVSGATATASGGTNYSWVGTSGSAVREFLWDRAGTFSRFRLNTLAVQPASGSLTCSFRLNGSLAGTPSTMQVIVAAGSPTGTVVSDLSDTVTVAQGDIVSILCTNTAGANAATFSASLTFTPQ